MPRVFQTWIGLSLVFGLILVIGASAFAQSLPRTPANDQQAPANEQNVDDQAVQDLISTLEDEQKRQQLIDDLSLLLDAQEQTSSPVNNGPIDLLQEEVTKRVGILNTVAEAVVDSGDQVPALMTWLQSTISNPDRLTNLARVALWVGFVLFAAWVAACLVKKAMTPWRRALIDGASERLRDRAFRSLVHWILAAIPSLVMVATAYLIMRVLGPNETNRSVAESLLLGILVTRPLVLAMRALFQAKQPKLRWIEIDDEDATRLEKRTVGLVSTAGYGYFGLLAARQVDLPWTLHGFLLHLLFFYVAIAVIFTILREHQRFAAMFRRVTHSGDDASELIPWRFLAQFWPLFASLAVVSLYLVWALKIPGGFSFLLRGTLLSALALLFALSIDRYLVSALGSDEPKSPPPEDEFGEQAAAATMTPTQYLAHGGLGLVTVLVLAEIWGLGLLSWLWSQQGQEVGTRLVAALLIVCVTYLLWRAVKAMIFSAVEATDSQGRPLRSNRTRTILVIARNVFGVLLALFATLTVLSELGGDIAPLLAGAGGVGLAGGFGSQKLVQDIITGFFILLEVTMSVGDVVEVGGRSGVVEAVTIRTVRLRDYSGHLHTIPYSAIDTVTNLTKDFSYAVFDIGVAYHEDVDRVMDVIREIGDAMQKDRSVRRLILEPIDVAGVDRFDESAVIIKARFKTRPLQQWTVGREFNRRLKRRFDELGIEIPFPYRTLVYAHGQEHRGAPPVEALPQQSTA
ncbi:MAG: mechanosensitive ion channel domain-containing protein [Geminicoccaceae bacterium]